MIVDLLKPEDIRWTRFLRRTPHDIYHLPEYSEFAAKHEGGKPVAFYAEHNGVSMLAPLLIRPLPKQLGAPDDWFDATTAYGYASPIFVGSGDSATLRDLLSAFRDHAAELGVVTAFLRLHPLLQLPLEVLPEYGQLVEHGRSVYIDLSLTAEELSAQTRPNHRKSFKKLTEAGFKVTIDDWSLLDCFIAIYRETMQRVSAAPFYFFSDDYFVDLHSTLDRRLHLFSVMNSDGDVASAGLFTAVDGIVEYHLGATSGRYLREAPSKLMFDCVRNWAKQCGNKLFHLGGGLGGCCDSLFEFKAGFSRSYARVHTYRMVVNHSRYKSLVDSWIKQNGDSPAAPLGFFPSYRRMQTGTATLN